VRQKSLCGHGGRMIVRSGSRQLAKVAASSIHTYSLPPTIDPRVSYYLLMPHLEDDYSQRCLTDCLVIPRDVREGLDERPLRHQRCATGVLALGATASPRRGSEHSRARKHKGTRRTGTCAGPQAGASVCVSFLCLFSLEPLLRSSVVSAYPPRPRPHHTRCQDICVRVLRD
jgi:hypothetical protein